MGARLSLDRDMGYGDVRNSVCTCTQSTRLACDVQHEQCRWLASTSVVCFALGRVSCTFSPTIDSCLMTLVFPSYRLVMQQRS